MVYHDDVFRSGYDSFDVLMPTSFVDATFQEVMVVVDKSIAAATGGLATSITRSSRVSHAMLVLIVIMVWCLGLPGLT